MGFSPNSGYGVIKSEIFENYNDCKDYVEVKNSNIARIINKKPNAKSLMQTHKKAIEYAKELECIHISIDEKELPEQKKTI